MTTDFQISATKTIISNPTATTLENGNYAVAWNIGQSGNPTPIYARLLDNNGNKIQNKPIEFVIEAENGYFPQIHPLQNNGFLISYETSISSTQYSLIAKLFNQDAYLVKEISVANFNLSSDTAITSPISHHSTAVFANGKFLMTWYNYDQVHSYGTVFGQRYTVDGNIDGSVFQISKSLPKYAVIETISYNINQFITIWGSYSYLGSSINGIYGNWFDENNTLIKLFKIDDYFSINLKATVLPNNGIAVVWCTQQLSPFSTSNKVNEKIYDNNFVPINQSEIKLDQWNPPEFPYHLSISDTKDGGFLISYQVFKNCENCKSDIFGQYFNYRGAKLGSSFQVNSEQTKNEYDIPEMTGFYLGKALVIWKEYQFPNGNGEDVIMGNFVHIPNIGISDTNQAIGLDSSLIIDNSEL